MSIILTEYKSQQWQKRSGQDRLTNCPQSQIWQPFMINGLDYGEVSPWTHFRVFLQLCSLLMQRRRRRRKADCLQRWMSGGKGKKGSEEGRLDWISRARSRAGVSLHKQQRALTANGEAANQRSLLPITLQDLFYPASPKLELLIQHPAAFTGHCWTKSDQTQVKTGQKDAAGLIYWPKCWYFPTRGLRSLPVVNADWEYLEK